MLTVVRLFQFYPIMIFKRLTLSEVADLRKRYIKAEINHETFVRFMILVADEIKYGARVYIYE